MEKISLKSISGRKLIEITSNIKKNNEVYTSSLEDIGKLVAKELIGDVIFSQLFFEDIRNKFITDNEKSIPKQEQDFFIYICKTYLLLDTEPRVHLLELNQRASEDLIEIEKNINKCNKQISEVQKQDKISDQDDYKIPRLKHFIRINEEKKNEITSFIESDKIKFLSFIKAQKFNFFYSSFQEFYWYRYDKKRYNIDNLSDIKFKFLELYTEKVDEIEQLYKNDKPEFFRYAEKYINEYKIIDKIRDEIEDYHYLNARKDVILPALDFYEKDNKVLFVNLIALQIEGMFYDYCLELGIPEKELSPMGIGEKIDKIVSINPKSFGYQSWRWYFYEFEYFKFKFPVIRNKVAHGRIMSSQEYAHISCLLLLDLHHICQCMILDHLPINLIIKILKSIKNTNNKFIINDDFIKIKYAIFYEKKKSITKTDKKILAEKILDFYDIHDTFNLLLTTLPEDAFFDYLFEVIKKGNPVVIQGINQMITSYKQEKIREDKCTELIREIQRLNLPKVKSISILEFFNAVT
ncbi:hypothetical protein [Trichormus variabilis]|uniref:Uncharacterized protein n=1 Tax=Trichormus variabilis SAG 1403-4b TaxID=447716 RepID=A0A433UHN2_ANAVA|nr:hypothetical protein [Trichormus variabilis]MBD2626736.1 hypothetical protein [Trichormus variabilis FACHB-164]RUS93351.1 hypothetical protein DSM107003_44070 [Trichormus variabilis SAG 1403-4b]